MTNRKPRILYLTTQSHTSGVFILPLAKWLRARGYEIAFACSFAEQPDAASYHDNIREAGFPLMEVPFPRHVTPSGDWNAMKVAREVLEAYQPDIVHTYNSKAGIVGRWAAFFDGQAKIVHSNYGLAFFKSGLFSVRQSLLFLIAEILTARVTDRIFAISPVEFDKTRDYWVAKPPKLVLSNIGVNTDFFSVENATSKPDTSLVTELRAKVAGKPVIGSVSRLVVEKGVDTLLKAAQKMLDDVPNLQVIVTGGGQEQPKLEALAADLGITAQVHFTGNITDREEVLQLYTLLDVFVLPTRWESFGLVFAEAMALGKPVVGPRHEPITTVVADGETGILVEPENVDAYAEALTRLLGDDTLREQMGAAGRQRTLTVWNEEQSFEVIEEQYRELLEEAKRPLPQGSPANITEN